MLADEKEEEEEEEEEEEKKKETCNAKITLLSGKRKKRTKTW